ncbi:transcriptional regulator, AbrB family [Dehalogenimonas lykanthroporepellens BL-DC-9]|nr:transcriptional regulator, AbrB family [Dehalogenimonas lykanthroporepellens BL-DC-9]
MNTAILSEKGWIVIPRELRQRYHLEKGDRMHVIDYGGVIALIPADVNPITKARGMLKGKTPLTRALTQSRREEAGCDR